MREFMRGLSYKYAIAFCFLLSIFLPLELPAVMLIDIPGVIFQVVDGVCYQTDGFCSVDFEVLEPGNSNGASFLKVGQRITSKLQLPLNPKLRIGQKIQADMAGTHGDLITLWIIPESIVVLDESDPVREIPFSRWGSVSAQDTAYSIVFISILLLGGSVFLFLYSRMKSKPMASSDSSKE